MKWTLLTVLYIICNYWNEFIIFIYGGTEVKEFNCESNIGDRSQFLLYEW